MEESEISRSTHYKLYICLTEILNCMKIINTQLEEIQVIIEQNTEANDY